jgi:GNAT superfamily N-acetyltransferase
MFGEEEVVKWENNKPIISHFETPEESVDKLSATGLNSIPAMCKPYHVLSTGEKFRADLARKLHSNTVIDEYTSVVNREVAKAASRAISRYVNKNGLTNIILATCHSDVLEWLEPDWTYNTDTGELKIGRYLRRPEIILDIYPARYEAWKSFANHHYLTAELNPIAECFIAIWDDCMVGFSANLQLPGRIPPLYEGDTRTKYRESRLVILPDYQGLGIGVKMSNAIGEMYLQRGHRYFSKTAHIRMGEYRQASPLWRKTQTNLKSREKSMSNSNKPQWHHLTLDTKRICYSHEYIGNHTTEELKRYAIKERAKQVEM